MRTTITICLLAISLHGLSQYALGKRTITFFDNNRSARAVATDLYYPANAAGTNVPLATGTEKFPVVVFGHGFVMPTTAYTWLADSLVKYGFIVAMPSTESSFSPSHDNFGHDIAFLCQRITSLNDSSSNFLFGRVFNKSAAGGHSMGAGCSFLAMNYNTSINALFNFAAAETTPSAKTAAFSVQKPSLIFSGSSDCIAAPSEQLQMYTNIPYTCKTYISITSGLHCQFGNNDATCVLGQITTGCNTSSITPSVIFQKTCSLLVPFLKYYLKSDCSAGTEFTDTYTNITGVTKQRTCTADPEGCVVTGVGNVDADKSISIFPNPATGNKIYIRSEKENIRWVQIFDAEGRMVWEMKGLNGRNVELLLSGKGVFNVRIGTGTRVVNKRIMFL